MAFYWAYGPDQKELSQIFQQHAAAGKKYMLLVSETLDDPMAVHEFTHTRAIHDQAEILPLLDDLQNRSFAGKFRLAGIFDLARDYDSQQNKSFAQLETLLNPAIRKVLTQREDSARLKARQQEWDQSPFFTRLFSSRLH